jgi:hypothetical protein
VRHTELFQTQDPLAAPRELVNGCRAHTADADDDLIKDVFAHALFVRRVASLVNAK